jgi:hypothetical protein
MEARMRRGGVATVVVAGAILGGIVAPTPAEEGPSAFEHFVAVKDGRLFDGDRELRFISFNIPNLNYVEDELAFHRLHPYRLPEEYEIRDALESVRQMGGQVVRLYTIPVRRMQDPADVPTFVLAPGQLDEASMQAMDRVLAVANQVGVRLIVPLLNNWQWMGGVPQYAAFREKDEGEFWTDPQLIAGALVWSLRSHRREGGFYWHSEPFGSGLFKAYHWPGFASGDDYDERDLLYAGEGREDDRYLKIVFRDPAQLSRVEIDHSPDSGTP